MKSYLAKIAGLAILAMMIRTSAFAQDDNSDNQNEGSRHHEEEIVIRHKGDKDTKVTIEIKDGQVLVNGKPLSEFDDSTISIHKMRVNRYGNDVFTFGSPDLATLAPGTIRAFPRGNWSFNDDQRPRAVLGVSSEKKEDVDGAKVMEVTKGSAAEKMGLKAGDIITKVDGDEISDPSSLSEKIGDHNPGDKVTVTFKRDGKEQQGTAVLGETKSPTVEPFNKVYRFNMPDMKLQTMPGQFETYFGNRPRFGIRAQDSEDGKGVKVLDVDDGSTAAKGGIKEGDIITRFDGKDVNSVAALSDAATAAKDKITVKVTVIREGKTQDLDVRVPRRLHTADL